MRDSSLSIFIFVETKEYLTYFIQETYFYLVKNTRNGSVWMSQTRNILIYARPPNTDSLRVRAVSFY